MDLAIKAFAVGLAALLFAGTLQARPIIYARSTSVMAEYREQAMTDFQVSYAPKHWVSFGLGHMQLDDGGTNARHSVTYAKLNLLLKRWNFEEAQANIFGWGGIGRAYIGEMWIQPATPNAPPSEHDHGLPPTAQPYLAAERDGIAFTSGGQIDFETRRIYASAKTDFQYSNVFWHRADTLQFGIAPYKHDMDKMATWLVLSARQYSGNMHEGEELALLLRFFKKAGWVETGVTTDGKFQAMAMLTF